MLTHDGHILGPLPAGRRSLGRSLMPDIGATLREARERNGLSIAACAERTRIRSKYLTALEENRFGTLPEPAYARGFLRTYAVAVGVEPQRLLAEYDVQMASARREPGPGAPLQLEAREPRRPGASPREQRRRTGRLLWLAVGLVLAIAAVVWIAQAVASEPPQGDGASVTFRGR